MTTLTYKELNRAAALRFLQTAVVVDDAATVNPPDGKGGVLNTPGLKEAASSTQHELRSSDEFDEQALPPTLKVDVKTFADALADKKITCGVLKPTIDEPASKTIDRVVNASAHVDLVVLDWILDPKSGLNSLEAIKRIISDDLGGCRVIGIYTSDPQLERIADHIEEGLDGVTRDDDDLLLRAGGTRIALFRKAGEEREDDGSGVQALDEVELAERLIEVFLDLASGWVRGIALNSMAAIRENVHVILTRLGPSLDLGYAGHLLRLDHPDEGAKQILDAIVGELRSVLDDDNSTHQGAELDAMFAWVAHRETEGNLAVAQELLTRYLTASKKDRGQDLQGEIIADLRKQGLIPVKKQEFGGKLFKASATALFTAAYDRDAARKGDGDFAALLALRHTYGSAIPYLRLGTIVSDPNRTHYWLCLQPSCDSVRLKGKSEAFPFMPLELVDGDVGEISFVVPDGDSNVQLFNPIVPALIVRNSFRPDPKSETVRFKMIKGNPGQFALRTTGRKKILWVGQLKPSHAARVAHRLGQQLSRIGLDESEWLLARSR
jgi:hypothetical protein